MEGGGLPRVLVLYASLHFPGNASVQRSSYIKTFIEFAWTVKNLTLAKQNEDSMTEKKKKPEHFKSLTKSGHTSAIADRLKTSTGDNIKWDHFDILINGQPGKLTF